MSKSNKILIQDKYGFKLDEAIEFTGLARSTLYDAMKTGELTFHKRGKRTVFLRPDLVKFLDSLPLGVSGEFRRWGAHK